MHFKKLNFVWKRYRRPLKHRRDETAFRQGQHLQVQLHQAEADNKLTVYYFDVGGFSTAPCVPYAWQKKYETLRLSSNPGKRLNVPGFLNKNNDSFFYGQEGGVTPQTIIHAFGAFGQRYAGHYEKTKQPCVVILDNASVHTSKAFLAAKEDWYPYGLVVHHFPPYSHKYLHKFIY